MIYIIQIFTVLVYIINLIAILSLVFYKREKPEKVLSWFIVLMSLPLVGLILYLYMGINWKDTVLKEKFSVEMLDFISSSLKEYDGEYKDMARMVSNTNGSPMFLFNNAQVFKDGTEKFEKLITDIEGAEHHVHLEYYIVKSDEIGKRVLGACIKKAREGVKVRIIMDKIGGRYVEKAYRKEMMEAGIEVVTFTAAFAFVSRFVDMSLNYRLHRKIAVIDGKIGYIGGNNIGDEYVGQSKFGYWRDTHLRVEGDFVLGLQGLFFDDFFAVLHRNEHSYKWEYMKRSEIYKREENFKGYFPKTEITEYLPMQLAYSGPESPLYSIELLFIKMISFAKERIYISTPYFIPSEGTLSALKTAILSGVDVRIIFPARYDHPVVGHASMTYLGEILELGGRVYLYNREKFAHNKAMVVDGKMFTMGTANFDVRSFFLNYECNAVVYDEYLASRMDGLFFSDMEDSVEFTLEDYQSRPRSTFMKESFFRVFSLLF